jgi:hypothetical protein
MSHYTRKGGKMIAFKDILKLLGWIAKFLNWKYWKDRAKDAEDQNKLDDQTHDAENDIHDKVDEVTRPPHGPDDDLLNSKLGRRRVRTKLRPKMSRQERRNRKRVARRNRVDRRNRRRAAPDDS